MNKERNINILFIFSLLLALMLRVKFELNFPKLNFDYSQMALRTINFIEGHGFTYSMVSLTDLSKVHYVSWNLWPIGFPMLLVPFYYLTGSLINSLVLMQVLGIILLIFGFLRIFKALDLSKLTQSAFLLFTAFLSTPYSYFATTDLLAAAIYIWVIALTIEICIKEKGNTLKKIIISALLFFSITLRYAYIQNMLVIPCFFTLFGLIRKDRKYFYTGIQILIGAAIPAYVFLTVNKMANYEGTEFVNNLIHFHFYWKMLTLFDAFPLKAFFYPLPLEFRIPANIVIIKIVRLSEYFFSVFILGYLLWIFFKRRNWVAGLKEKKVIDVFSFFSLICLAVITGFLSLQSITTSPIPLPWGPHWMPSIYTFVCGTRYFSVLIFLIQILFFLLMDGVLKKTVKIKYAPAFVYATFILSSSISIINWSYTTYQYHVGSGYSYWDEGKDLITVHKIIDLDAEKNPGLNIILATCWNRKDVVPGDPTMFSKYTTITCAYDSIITGKYNHSKPLILYVLMPETKLSAPEENFISSVKAKKIFQWDKGILYSGGVLYRTYLP